MSKFSEVELPESATNTKSWLSDKEIMETMYEDYNVCLLDQNKEKDK